jgi:hypothetical protein
VTVPRSPAVGQVAGRKGRERRWDLADREAGVLTVGEVIFLL